MSTDSMTNHQLICTTMIDPEQYVFPHKELKHKRTEEEQRQADETLEYLEALAFRPHGVEW